MSDIKLPYWCQELLEGCPSSGSGVHQWIFRVVVKCAWFCSDDQLHELIRKHSMDCGRKIPYREIEQAITNGRPVAWVPKEGFKLDRCLVFRHELQSGKMDIEAARKRTGWVRDIDGTVVLPEPNEDLRGNVRSIWTGKDLILASEFKPSGMKPSEVIPVLFPLPGLLCLAWRTSKSETRTRSEWLRVGMDMMPLIVPAYMLGVRGLTKEGRESYRGLSNTGPKLYIIVEFDSPEDSLDNQASFLIHLTKIAPLALVCYSGGKSLHGWFCCSGWDQDQINYFYHQAVLLGADPASRTRNQLVRLPGGKRQENGKQQTIIYLNSQALPWTTPEIKAPKNNHRRSLSPNPLQL